MISNPSKRSWAAWALVKQAATGRWKEFEADVNAANARLRKSIKTATS